MVDKKISGLTEVTSLADNDVLLGVDVSDQSMSTSGTNVKIVKSNLFTGYETSTQLNTRDVNNRNRANHTGTQLLNTISNAGTLAGLNTVGSAQITNNSITNAHIANGSISETKLTDYLEYTFTPIFASTVNDLSVTYTIQQGHIIQKGSQVYVMFNLSWSTLTSTGVISITGMPTAKSFGANTIRFPLDISYYDSLSLPSGHTLKGYILDNTDYISLLSGNNLSFNNSITATELSSSGEIQGTILYYV